MASIDWAYLFNGFHGRIDRQTFWIGMIVLTAIELIFHFVAEQIQGERLSAIVDLAFLDGDNQSNPSTMWTQIVAGRACARPNRYRSIWNTIAIRPTMKADATASSHENHIRFSKLP